jgi:transcriptional regulator with XRE-family HTH domain
MIPVYVVICKENRLYIFIINKIFMKHKEIKNRITIIVESLGGNQSQLAREIGLQPGHLSNVMATDVGLSATILIGLANRGVNMNWLLMGTGETMWVKDLNLDVEAGKRITALEVEIRDANTLIDSLERILRK